MATTFSIGTVLVDRYRLDEVLGTGRTVEVYRAEDLSLGREVAIKVLRPELNALEDVRRAFRAQVVRAASLSHPHVARVYDGGIESHVLFMVTELLTGGSVEDIVADGTTLSVEDAASLGRDVAEALSYLHDQGIVHGGLTPSKLLFDDEGHVRVSDVALAGLGEAYREQFSLRDARYLSPEQARGEGPVSRSDVYSLGLIIFELVTGDVAFDGSTPEEVLRARLGASLPVRSELGTLDMVLAQATTADVEYRLEASQFATRLGAVTPDALPFTWSGIPSPTILGGFTPSEPRNTIGFSAPSPDDVVRAPRPTGAQKPVRADVPGRTPRATEMSDFNLERSGRRRLWFLVASIALVVAGAGAGAAYKLGLFSSHHTVPSLTGLTLAQAGSLLQGDGYTLEAGSHVNSATVAAGTILSQTPSGGNSAPAGTTIHVTISDGPELVTLPTTIVGSNCTQATAALASLNINAACPASAAVNSATVPAGRVALVLYNGSRNPLSVPKGATVTLALSSGPSATGTTGATGTPASTTTTTLPKGTLAMPNFVGLTRAQVNALSFKDEIYYNTNSPNAPWSTVVSQSIAPGTPVKRLSTVKLTVK